MGESQLLGCATPCPDNADRLHRLVIGDYDAARCGHQATCTCGLWRLAATDEALARRTA